MSEAEKRELVRLIERGDRYGLMLAAVRSWTSAAHADAAHSAVYVFHPDETPPVRITVPASASSPPVAG